MSLWWLEKGWTEALCAVVVPKFGLTAILIGGIAITVFRVS